MKTITRIVAVLLIHCMIAEHTIMTSIGFVGVGLLSGGVYREGRSQGLPLQFPLTSQALALSTPSIRPRQGTPTIASRISMETAALRPAAPAAPERHSIIPFLGDWFERWMAPWESLGWAWLSWRLSIWMLHVVGYGFSLHRAPNLLVIIGIYCVISGFLITCVNWGLHDLVYRLSAHFSLSLQRRGPPRLKWWGDGLGDPTALIPVWFWSAASAAIIVAGFSSFLGPFRTPAVLAIWALGQMAWTFGSGHILFHYLQNLTHGPGQRWSLIPGPPEDRPWRDAKKIQRYRNEAFGALRVDSRSVAIQILRNGLNEFPGSAELAFELAEMLVHDAESQEETKRLLLLNEARELLKAAAKASPARVDVYRRLGDISCVMQEWREAARYIEAELAIQRSATAFALLADTYLKMNDLENAAHTLAKASLYYRKYSAVSDLWQEWDRRMGIAQPHPAQEGESAAKPDWTPPKESKWDKAQTFFRMREYRKAAKSCGTNVK